MSIPKKLLNAAVKNQTALDQYGHNLEGKVQSLLRTVENEIVGRVAYMDTTATTMTDWKIKRLEALKQQIKYLLDETYKKIINDMSDTLQIVSGLQEDYTIKSFNKAVKVDLFKVVLTPENLKSIVEKSLIDGKLISDWFQKQNADLQSRLFTVLQEGTLRIQSGLVQGESIGELIGRIRGNKQWSPIMNISRRETAALVRTSVMSVANAARMETYQANADVLDGFEWISTLDSRTTLLCASLDGKRFDMDMNPVGHSIPFPGIPAHWGCRSCLCPVTKSWAELAGANGRTKKQINQLNNIPKGERASMNGPIPAQTYDEWLRDQSEETQKEILGPGRFDLWKRNKLGMADLVNNKGNPIPLEQLKQRLKVK